MFNNSVRTNCETEILRQATKHEDMAKLNHQHSTGHYAEADFFQNRFQNEFSYSLQNTFANGNLNTSAPYNRTPLPFV